jgi:hypothetical protein
MILELNVQALAYFGGDFVNLVAAEDLFLAKVAAEPLAQLQPRAQQARFDGGNAQAQRLGGLFGGKSFHVAQHKDHAKALRQALNGFRRISASSAWV